LKQLKAGRNFVEYLLKQINLFYPIEINISEVVFRGILFKTRKNRTPLKGTSKPNKILFEDRNGLCCTTLSCNKIYKLQMIKEGIVF